MKLPLKYFPDLSVDQLQKFKAISEALQEWNQKINVVSRKDIDQLEERHILHSMAIAKFISFKPGTKILDVGTGGGFPGLPLAILFPECEFTLVDSIAKKILVVNELTAAAELKNVKTIQARAESLTKKYDFIVSRAVTKFPMFYTWTKNLIAPKSFNDINNGIIYLKGGDLSQELGSFGKRIKFTPLNKWFEEEWFNEKGIVYLPSIKAR